MIQAVTTYIKVITAVCILHSSLHWKASGQTVSQRDEVIEWYPNLKELHMNWTFNHIVGSDVYTECWSLSMWNISSSNTIINLGQNCPLEVQLGVNIFLWLDPSFVNRRRNLVKVSEAEFTNCSQRVFPKIKLLIGERAKGRQQINPMWLSVGKHFLVEVQDDAPPLCRIGLQINLTVKPEYCKASNDSALCSSHGKCQTQPWQAAYYCHCQLPYTGLYCEEYDACSARPCLNGGTCADRKEGLEGRDHDCTCPPQFSGMLLFMF